MLALNNMYISTNLQLPQTSPFTALLQCFFKSLTAALQQSCSFCMGRTVYFKDNIKRVPYRVFKFCNPDPKLCVILLF